MMRQLDYQARVFDTLDAYLAELTKQKIEADKVEDLKKQNPGLPIPSVDFAEAAWTEMKGSGKLPASRANVPFSARHDGCGRVVPNVTLKVPTGGGKTYLAVNGVSKVLSKYLGQNAGFVLWIVPNEAIYTQTLKNLKNREHPYRQVLDRASAFRTKIMEKGDRLNAVDVETHLCVMVLMLQSGNRENKETLRMFRDRGDVHGFFPPEGEQQSHHAAFEQTPNLDGYDHDLYPMVKDSLGNALRVIRPVVVMDEGQKATSLLAYETLYGFNPCFVLELTATPKDVKATDNRPARFANLLVEVMGRELHKEEMIKMPLNLDPRQGTDWRTTLTAGLDKLNEIDNAARAFKAEKGPTRYIRPIMLVQVERTGKEQRDGEHIHSEDVKEWLLTAGLDDAEVAIKTAEKNDLSQPENLDLLSETNRCTRDRHQVRFAGRLGLSLCLCALLVVGVLQSICDDAAGGAYLASTSRSKNGRRYLGRMSRHYPSRGHCDCGRFYQEGPGGGWVGRHGFGSCGRRCRSPARIATDQQKAGV